MLAQEEAFIRERCSEFRGEIKVVSSAVLKTDPANAALHSLSVSLIPATSLVNDDDSDQAEPLVCNLDAIPLPSDSVDLLVLHHTLEFSANPHRVLSEAVRILAPRGHLMVVGFNPRSMLGLRRWIIALFARKLPWAHHPLPVNRVSDWLSLMNCEPAGVGQGFYQPPFHQRHLLKWFAWMNRFFSAWGIPGGGFYILHACKFRYAGTSRSAQESLVPQMAKLSLVGNASVAPRQNASRGIVVPFKRDEEDSLQP